MPKRASPGDGSLRKRKDGLWEYRAVVENDEFGNPVRKSFFSHDKSGIGAKKKCREYVKSGEDALSKVYTVGQWALKWLDIYKKNGAKKVEYSTYRNYEMYVKNRIIPAIGAVRLDEIRPAHIEQLYKDLPEDMSESARRHINIALNGIFKTAVENHYCRENPVKPMAMPKSDPEGIKVFSPKQIKKIMAEAKTDPNGIYVLFPLYTGMRVSEITALTWGNIDYKQKEITVCAAMTRSEEGGYESGKTKSKKTRIVPISAAFAKILKKMPVNGLYVLTDSGDAPLTLHQYEHRYQKFFTDHGIDYLSPHKCRHTYATYLLRGGADLRTVQTLLGHSNVNVTEIYTHVNTDDLKNNIKKLGY